LAGASGIDVLAAGAVFELVSAGAVFVSAGAAVFAFASNGTSILALVSNAGASVVTGASSGLLESTDTLPVKAGIESSRAETINIAAAVIVILESTVAVPLGLNAELETLLVNKAPASVLPGCSNTAATNTMHERKNNPYKK
jgi:hypothetical protein